MPQPIKSLKRVAILFAIVGAITTTASAQAEFSNQETSDYQSSWKSQNFTWLSWDRNHDGAGLFSSANRPMFFYWDNDDNAFGYLVDTRNMSNLKAKFYSAEILDNLLVNTSKSIHATFKGSFQGIQGIQVERDGGDYIQLVTNYDGYGSGLNASSKLRFAVNGNGINTPSMVIDTDGKVGVGTTSPNLNLHVEESSNGQVGLRIRNANNGSNGYTSLRLNNADGTASTSQVLMFLNSPTRTTDGGFNAFTLRNNIGDTRLQSQGENGIIIKANTGFVGIGPDDPTASLHITSSTIDGTPNIAGTQIRSGAIELALDGGVPYIDFNNGVEGNDFDARFRLTGDNTLKMEGADFIVNNDLGIGTSSPLAKLHVDGGAQDDLIWPIIAGNSYNNQTLSNYGVGIKLKHSLNSEDYKWGGIASVQEGEWANRSALYLYANETPYVKLTSYGKMGIGDSLAISDITAELTVDGDIMAEEVRVEVVDGTGPDYVFEDDYPLASLEEISNYIEMNKHLPEVPSAKEMETNGIGLSAMNMLLLKKVEELTLHLIEQHEKIKEMEERLQAVEEN